MNRVVPFPLEPNHLTESCFNDANPAGCCVMPRTYDLKPIQRASVIRRCPACGDTSMRIVTTRPSDQYRDFDECTYRCACGEETVCVMMRPI
jgi:hypothetical protein